MGLLTNLLIFSVLPFASRPSYSQEVTSGTMIDINAELSRRHEQWMTQHGRVYRDEDEREMRFQIFKRNVAYIEAFNNEEESTYKLAINQFADLTIEEIKAANRGCGNHKLPCSIVQSTLMYENVTDVPSSVDWRNHGVVSPVRKQGNCGSCWAISAADAVEGITALKSGRLTVLSPQELIDCVHSCGCNGCTLKKAFSYIKQAGLSTEQSYPYKEMEQACNTSTRPVTLIKDFGQVRSSETALMNAVAHQPISVSLDAGSSSFKFYGGGIYTGVCGKNLNHKATVVGYGVDEHGTKYWLVKNSWGTEWGERGYIRMKRDIGDPQGLCGITMFAYYPTA